MDDDGRGDRRRGADESAAADNELVKFVNKVIIDAYNQKVSDIHIEPLPGKAKTGIRFRIDGTLQPYIEVPAHFRQAMVTRLKIMCDLDISEKRKPQDGKIKFKKFGPLDIELRVATIPSAGGVEDVVMRILAAGEPIPLEKLGLTPHNKERLEKTVSKPYGLFYVCGPTGSGKTTTLHSILKFLNTPDTKIWTAEDPVEITQKGLRQVQINTQGGHRLRRWSCGPSCAPTRHHHGRRDRATRKPCRWASRLRSPATWCSPRCTPTPRPNRSPACWTWAWTRSTSPTRCWASWRSAWPRSCATARRNTRPSRTSCKRSCANTART